jgi:hypothetical protein
MALIQVGLPSCGDGVRGIVVHSKTKELKTVPIGRGIIVHLKTKELKTVPIGWGASGAPRAAAVACDESVPRGKCSGTMAPGYGTECAKSAEA